MVTLADQTHAAKADSKGRWQAEFSARNTGKDLHLTVKASDGSASSGDLAFGDVWLCSGQSNMEYPLSRALGYAETQAAAEPDLRLMKVPHQVADAPQSSFKEPPLWKVSSPDAGANFSAACYFMASQLRETEKVAERSDPFCGLIRR